MTAPTFDLAAAVARVTDRVLHDPLYWERVGLPMPVRYLEDSITIPASIKAAAIAPAAAMEAGRLAYLADPEIGRKRYEKALREFTKQVDEHVRRIQEERNGD